MSETDNNVTAGVRYPFINLEKAIARAKELFDADQKGREMAISGAFGVWGYSDKSSGGFQTIGALKMYGLLKDSGVGDSRKFALSDAALRYFRDEREEPKKKLLREFAIKPKLIAALWKDWHASPPADTIARSHLKAERGLNDQSARALLSIYKENLAFADLKPGDKVDEPETEETDEIARDQTDNQKTAAQQAGPGDRPKRREVKQGMKEDVFSLREGDVTLQWPDGLSAESFQDLEDWTKLLLRKIKRSVGTAPSTKDADD
jgi:hypothetical protein